MAAPTPVQLGSGTFAVNFAWTGSNGIAVTQTSGTGLGKIILQDASHSLNADVDDNRDGQGNVVQRTFYNQNDEATLELLVFGSGLADAISQTTIPSVGSVLSITACASYPALIKTNWIVESGSELKGGNTNAKKISLKLKAFGGITAVSAA